MLNNTRRKQSAKHKSWEILHDKHIPYQSTKEKIGKVPHYRSKEIEKFIEPYTYDLFAFLCIYHTSIKMFFTVKSTLLKNPNCKNHHLPLLH